MMFMICWNTVTMAAKEFPLYVNTKDQAALKGTGSGKGYINKSKGI